MTFENRGELPDLSREQQQGVEAISNFEIGSQSRVDLILIYLGEKPGTDLDIYTWNDAPQKIKATLEELGLTVIEATAKRPKKIAARFYVSKAPETAQALSNLSASKDHESFGRLMGFPQSAIDAFVGKTARAAEEQLDESKPENQGLIIAMARSADNFEAETALMRRWSNMIKKYAPEVYESLLPHNDTK